MFSDAMGKMKDAAGKITDQLPDKYKRKADRKLGFFIHKYIATLFYFDDDIQEVYYDMAEAYENGDIEEVFQYSDEMKSIILMKSDPNSGYYSRRVDKRMKKIAKKMEGKADELEKYAEKGRTGLLKKIASEGWVNTGGKLEDLDEEDFNLPDLEDEGELEE